MIDDMRCAPACCHVVACARVTRHACVGHVVHVCRTRGARVSDTWCTCVRHVARV